MKITLKDGSVMEFEQAMSVLDVAKSISEGLARVATSAKVDGDIVDLRTVLDKDCELEILTFDSEDGNGAFNHTAAHIMAQAVKRLYPETKLAIGPSTEHHVTGSLFPLFPDPLQKLRRSPGNHFHPDSGPLLKLLYDRRIDLLLVGSIHRKPLLLTHLLRSLSAALPCATARRTHRCNCNSKEHRPYVSLSLHSPKSPF